MLLDSKSQAFDINKILELSHNAASLVDLARTYGIDVSMLRYNLAKVKYGCLLSTVKENIKNGRNREDGTAIVCS